MSDRIDQHRDRIEGTVDQVQGRGKQALGDLSGDEQTRSEGQTDEAKGMGKQTLADAKEKVADLKDKLPG